MIQLHSHKKTIFLDQLNEISFELLIETIFNVNDLRNCAALLMQQRKVGRKIQALTGLEP